MTDTTMTAKDLRDVGIALVTQNSGAWMGLALDALKTVPTGWTGTGEDLRHLVSDVVGEPHHVNAYGALIRTAVKRKLITATGRWLHMRDKQSHARMTPEYKQGANQ